MMSITQRLTAVGATDLVVLSRYTYNYGVSLRVQLLPSATATYSVEHTFDDPFILRPAAFTRATTTATFTLTAHQLASNDAVRLSPVAPLNGFIGEVGLTQTSNLLTVTGVNTFTVPVLDAGPAAGIWGVVVCRMANHDTLTALTASAQGNYQFSPTACRVRATAITTGLDFYVDPQGV